MLCVFSIEWNGIAEIESMIQLLICDTLISFCSMHLNEE